MKKTMLPAISALILCMGTGCGILTVNGGGFAHEYHEEYCGNNTANTEVTPAPAEQPANLWFCPECGRKNDDNFCPHCGTKRPVQIKKCGHCGYQPDDQSKLPKFCPPCGAPFGG